MNNNNLSFTAVASIVLAYITLSGCLWHLGYWSTFKFNFLEFANISDIFQSTVYPFFKNFWIFIGLSLLSIGVTALSYFSLLNNKKSQPKNPEFVSHELLYKKIAIFLIAVSAIVSSFFSGVFFGGQIIFKIFPISLGILIGSSLFYLSFLKNQIKKDDVRLIALIGISLFPALNFSLAKSQSFEIKAMLKYNEVTDIITSDSLLSKQLLHTAFLGSTINYHFFYTIIIWHHVNIRFCVLLIRRHNCLQDIRL